MQTTEAEWYATGHIGSGGTANPASAPYDESDGVIFAFSPDREQNDDVLNRGPGHGGTPVFESLNDGNLIDIIVTNNLGFDILIVDFIINVTEATQTDQYTPPSPGYLFGNTSMLHVSSLNAMQDGQLAGFRYVDQDETRQAFPWWDNECGRGSTGNDPEKPGPKVGPSSMREYPGSTPRSTLVPPERLANGATLKDVFAGRWFGWKVNGTQVSGTVEFKLLYRFVEEAPLLVNSVAINNDTTFDTPGCPRQVNVTVTNTGITPLTCTVSALFLDSYAPNWIEIGAQTVLLPPSIPQLFTFTWTFDGSIADRSDIRRGLNATVYPCWTGLPVMGMVIANAGAGLTSFAELIDTDPNDDMQVKSAGDGNGDGNINFVDLGILAAAYGATPASGNWSPQADYDCTNKINFLDLGLLAANYGRKY